MCNVAHLNTHGVRDLFNKLSVFESFVSAEKPLSDEIVECDCEECLLIAKTFKKISHEKYKLKTINKHFLDLPLFSPKAYRYFLPIFITESLKDLYSSLCSQLIINLSPKEIDDFHYQRFSQFNNLEKGEIFNFFKIVNESNMFENFDDEINRALKFWNP